MILGSRLRDPHDYSGCREDINALYSYDGPHLRWRIENYRNTVLGCFGAKHAVLLNRYEIKEETLDWVQGGFILVNRRQARRKMDFQTKFQGRAAPGSARSALSDMQLGAARCTAHGAVEFPQVAHADDAREGSAREGQR